MFVHRLTRVPTERASERSNRRGVTATEFAVVAPVFFLFLWSTFEFGKLYMIRHTADNAAYEACRHIIVPGATVERRMIDWPGWNSGKSSSSALRICEMSISMWLNAGVPSVSTM